MLCIFNLSPETHRVRLTGAGAMALAEGAEHGRDGTLTLHPNGFAIMEVVGKAEIADIGPVSEVQARVLDHHGN